MSTAKLTAVGQSKAKRFAEKVNTVVESIPCHILIAGSCQAGKCSQHESKGAIKTKAHSPVYRP